MKIVLCERCGDEVETRDLNNIGLCADCAEEEEQKDRGVISSDPGSDTDSDAKEGQ